MLTAEEIKNKVLEIKEIEKKGAFTSGFVLPAGTKVNNYQILAQPLRVKLWYVRDCGVYNYGFWGCVYDAQSLEEAKAKELQAKYNYRMSLDWKQLAEDKLANKAIEEWLEKITPNFDIEKVGGVITFTKKATGEKLLCDLGKQTFTRTYLKGKPRVINYPMQFFKHVSGRLLTRKIAAEGTKNFQILMEDVAKNYSLCRNFGTFLVRMFDHQHLEQYIAAGVKYSFQTPFAYSEFDKDIRNKLNENNIVYTEHIGALFCSEKDLGRALFAQIKDKPGFKNMLRLLENNIQPLNTLVNHYNYDLKTLFEYCRKRNWQSGKIHVYRWFNESDEDYDKRVEAEKNAANPETKTNPITNFGNYDCITMLRDYARMARTVYGDNFEKYPENLVNAHDEADILQRERKLDDATRATFETTIDLSLEWKGKDYVVLYPKTADEILAEGVRLKHCVGSYINGVINGECKIVFLREKENPEKPLVTIEIANGNIRQARGFGNSNPRYDAKQALKEYAKAKKFLYF